jgi:hypothetical protein
MFAWGVIVDEPCLDGFHVLCCAAAVLLLCCCCAVLLLCCAAAVVLLLLLLLLLRGLKLKAENEEDAAYDRAARELVFDAKGQVSRWNTLLPAHTAVCVCKYIVWLCVCVFVNLICTVGTWLLVLSVTVRQVAVLLGLREAHWTRTAVCYLVILRATVCH